MAGNLDAGSAVNAPAKRSRKAKRTLTPDNLLRTVGRVVASGPVLVSAMIRPKTSAALREKIADLSRYRFDRIETPIAQAGCGEREVRV